MSRPTTGTPPRGRGRPRWLGRAHHQHRNTPARAGTTVRGCTLPRRLREHPRAGGDDFMGSGEFDAAVGTPPRGRGRLPRELGELLHHRNTPARAGTTLRSAAAAVACAEHPRAGGDDSSPCASSSSSRGTPPRGRGRHVLTGQRPGPARNTPARAGTTTPCSALGHGPGEHPRAGGDDMGAQIAHNHGAGTPPRGRGRHERIRDPGIGQGNTPARAGTTWSPKARRWSVMEHPRAGGDDIPR